MDIKYYNFRLGWIMLIMTVSLHPDLDVSIWQRVAWFGFTVSWVLDGWIEHLAKG